MIEPGLNFFGHLVVAGMTLDSLEKYLSVTENFLIETRKQSIDQKEKQVYDPSIDFEVTFPSILYESVIISTVAFLEREVITYAKTLKNSESSSLSVRDLSGSWLERFRKYSEKVIGMNLYIKNTLWQDLNGVVEIRNCLVHSGGYLPDFQKRTIVEHFCKRHCEDCIVGYILEPNHELTKLVLRIISEFVNHIYETALTKYHYKT